MEPMWINNELVHSHSLWRICPSTMQTVIEEDSPRKGYLQDIPTIDCLALDKYAPAMHLSATQKTGDVAIGVAVKRDNGQLKNSQIQIVELRLNYTNGKNVSYTKLNGKIQGSLNLLGREITISPSYYFVFTDRVAPVAEWALNRTRIAARAQHNYYVIGVSAFKSALRF